MHTLVDDLKSKDFRVSFIMAVLVFFITYLVPKVLHRTME